MADNGGERTEKATPKRRAKLRSEGRVARSVEISHTGVLLGTLIALSFEGSRLLNASEQIVSEGLSRTANPTQLDGGVGVMGLVMSSLDSFGSAIWPIVAVAAAVGIITNVAQVGLRFSTKSIKPSFTKLNLFTGLKRMFGKNQLVELAKSIAKVAIVGTVAGVALWTSLPSFGLLVGSSPGSIVADIGQTVLSIGYEAGGALAVIAILDYIWQRRKFEKMTRMTKEEIKREVREADLSPELRGMIRRRQGEAARRRMLADVPTADVVVVNPTHFAVALRYDGTKPAPEVVAKGIDHLALTIRRIAEEAGVTIVHQPQLARALHRDVELGQMIPDQFFHAVAEVLAFVFRTAGRRRRVA